MFWHRRGKEQYVVASGAVKKTQGLLEWKRHIFVGDTKDGGCATCLGTVGDKAQEAWIAAEGGVKVPVDWPAKTETETERSDGDERGEDMLRARCLCKGVDFYITRPTTQSGMLCLILTTPNEHYVCHAPH